MWLQLAHRVGRSSQATPSAVDKFPWSSNTKIQTVPAEGPLHDPVTVAMVALPSIVKSQRAHLDVELQGTFTAGATSVDMFNMLKQEPNATIATVLDVDMYWNLIADAVATLK